MSKEKKQKEKANDKSILKQEVKLRINLLKDAIKDKKTFEERQKGRPQFSARIIDDFQQALERIILCIKLYNINEEIKKFASDHPGLPDSEIDKIDQYVKEGDKLLQQHCGIRPNIS
ncbi:MAG: hypothetical protein IPP72_17950 [Chitinophagaceae bacterium]|nr:hypothetical protein [Chitinophagaceae bacterium]